MTEDRRRRLADHAALGISLLRARAELDGRGRASDRHSTYELLLAHVPWAELRGSLAACGALILHDASESAIERLILLRMQQHQLERALCIVRMGRLVGPAADAVLGSLVDDHRPPRRGTEAELFTMATLVLALIEATGPIGACLQEQLQALHRTAMLAGAGVA